MTQQHSTVTLFKYIWTPKIYSGNEYSQIVIEVVKECNMYEYMEKAERSRSSTAQQWYFSLSH